MNFEKEVKIICSNGSEERKRKIILLSLLFYSFFQKEGEKVMKSFLAFQSCFFFLFHPPSFLVPFSFFLSKDIDSICTLYSRTAQLASLLPLPFPISTIPDPRLSNSSINNPFRHLLHFKSCFQHFFFLHLFFLFSSVDSFRLKLFLLTETYFHSFSFFFSLSFFPPLSFSLFLSFSQSCFRSH